MFVHCKTIIAYIRRQEETCSNALSEAFIYVYSTRSELLLLSLSVYIEELYSYYIGSDIRALAVIWIKAIYKIRRNVRHTKNTYN